VLPKPAPKKVILSFFLSSFSLSSFFLSFFLYLFISFIILIMLKKKVNENLGCQAFKRMQKAP